MKDNRLKEYTKDRKLILDPEDETGYVYAYVMKGDEIRLE